MLDFHSSGICDLIKMLFTSLTISVYNFSPPYLIISFVISYIPGDLQFFDVLMVLKTFYLVTSTFILMFSDKEHAPVCFGSYNSVKYFIQVSFLIFVVMMYSFIYFYWFLTVLHTYFCKP